MQKKNLSLTDLIDIDFLQEFQDAFALSTDIASVIIDKSGQLTKPSNFTDFYINYKKSLNLQDENCNCCNVKWTQTKNKKDGASIYECEFGLTNFAAPIIVDGQHIASILGGQIIVKELNEDKFRKIAQKIGINENKFIEDLKKIKILTPEQLKTTSELLRMTANSISKIANKNLELMKKNEREALTKQIFESIRSSLDIEETLRITCYALTKAFNLERAVIVQFPDKKDLRNIVTRKEFKVRKSIKSPEDIENRVDVGEFVAKTFLKSPNPLIIDNVAKSNYPKFFKEFYKIMGVKSLLWFPILLQGELWGAFTLSSLSNYKHWDEDELKIIGDLANQIAIAINQAETYEKEKKTAEREIALRETINIIRSTFDIEKIRKNFLEIACNYFNADRCLFVEYDKETNKFLPFDIEIITKNGIKSLVGVSVEDDFPEFAYKLKNLKRNIIIKDLEKTLARANLPNYKAIQTLRNSDAKSDYGFIVEYQNKILGILILHYVQNKRILSHEELAFLKVLRNQAGTSLYQAGLFKRNRQIAENEKVLRQIMLSLASTFDFQEIIVSIVTEAGKFFKADRCFYVEIEPGTTYNRPIKEWAEYLSSPSIKSHIQRVTSKEETEGFIKETLKKKIIVCSDIKKEEIPKSTRKMLEDELSVKSYLVLPVYSQKAVHGSLVFHYVNSYKNFNNNDLYVAEAIAKQISIAINQSHLYEKGKLLLKKETFLREAIQIFRSKNNPEEIKRNFVEITRNYFDADRCLFCDYDKETKKFLPFKTEKLKSPDIKSLIGVDVEEETPEFVSRQLKRKNVIIRDLEKTLSKINKSSAKHKALLTMYESGVKSDYGFLVEYKGKFLGVLIIHFVKEKRVLTSEELSFLKILRDQAAIALYQADLFKENKQVAENEKLLRQLMLSSVTSFNYEEIINTIVNKAGEFFEADRCFYIEIDIGTASNRPIKHWAEYLSSPDIEPHRPIKKEETQGFVNTTSQKKIVFCTDLEKENIPEAAKEMLRELSVKSYLVAPVYYGAIIYGALVLHYVKNFKQFVQEDLYMGQAIANQAAIVINQSEVYKQQKETAERESLLRRVTEAMKLNLDIKEVKQKIVNEIGRTLEADRCYLREYDKAENIFLKPDVEYLSSHDMKSIMGIEPNQEASQYFLEEIKRKPNLPIQLTPTSISDIENPALKEFFEYSEIKTHFSVPIFDKEKNLTLLVLQYAKRTDSLQEEESKLLITLAKQIAIAFDQSNLYKETKQQAERERITQNVINIIRSSLELDTILKNVCEELLKMIDVQRIFVSNIDFEKKQTFVEVTTTDEIVKFTKMDHYTFTLLAEYWRSEIYRTKAIKAVDDIEKSDMPEIIKQVYINANVYSIICIPIKSKEKIWGAIFLSATKNYHNWNKDDIKFLESIVTQLDTAIRQSELYDNQRKSANKEKVLKDIISEIKLTRDLHQAYEKLLKKLAQIFNLNRTLFLESSKIDPEELNIQYEYAIKREDMTPNNIVFPQVCIEEFLNLIHNLQPLILNDVSQCYPEQTTEFFEKYKIRALLAFPLIKYNKEIKVLGFIVLCSEIVRRWTDEEIELMNAISDSVVSVIWEIAKFIETEELRDSFVSTLAHDFQVPLIGEKVALEYMLQYSETELGENGKIIKEIFENNQNIIELLNKSVDIYNYESGKKKLILTTYKIDSILNEAFILSKELADSKNIILNFKKGVTTLFVEADKRELLKVFQVLIENAIEHSEEGGEVKIEYYQKSGRIIVSIHNAGKPIALEIQEKIFNRYEMAQAIERKIGAGTGLFLAKRIVEAHKGAIWFKTDKDIGTIFYVGLPLAVTPM